MPMTNEVIKELLAPVNEVYIYQMERTRTGTTRRVRLFGVVSGRITELTRPICIASGGQLRYDQDRECIRIQGTGFSMGSHLKPYFDDILGHPVAVTML